MAHGFCGGAPRRRLSLRSIFTTFLSAAALCASNTPSAGEGSGYKAEERPVTVQRDRELDAYAATLIVDKKPHSASELARISVQSLRESDDLVPARGVVVSRLYELDENPRAAASSSERAEYEKLLNELDKEIADIPIWVLVDNATKASNQHMDHTAVAYHYEIFTRPQNPPDHARTAAELCLAMYRDLSKDKSKEEDISSWDKVLHYCDIAFNALDPSTDRNDKHLMQAVTTALTLTWGKSGKPLSAYPYTERWLQHLEPIEIEREIRNMNYVMAALSIIDGKPSDQKSVDKALSMTHTRYLAAKRLGSDKEMGRALLSQGGIYEATGELAEAARAYDEAQKHFAASGYLSVNVYAAPMLAQYATLWKSGSPETLLRKKVEDAKKSGNKAALAQAYEELATTLSRENRSKQRSDTYEAMYEAAQGAGDKTLMARALVLLSAVPVKKRMGKEKLDRLVEASQLYRELKDSAKEAETLMLLTRYDRANADRYRTRILSLQGSIDDPRVLALVYQMRAIYAENAGDFDEMRRDGLQCRKNWARLGAREQVAHCEVILATAEKSLGKNSMSCTYLKSARNTFNEVGMPSRAALQERKAEQQSCRPF